MTENNENQKTGVSLPETNYEQKNSKWGMKLFFVAAFICLLWIIFFLGEDDQPKQNAQDTQTVETTNSPLPEVRKENCKDEFGRPKERYCKKALKNEGLDVSKIKKWGGSDNGENSAICTFSYLGEIYAYEVIFDSKCNAISVKQY